MVASGPQVSAEAMPGEATGYRRAAPIRARSTLQRLALSLTRVAGLESHILLLHAKITAVRIVWHAVLYTLAAMLGLLSIVFLYIGAFQVLTTYVMASQWAYLLMGGVHLAVAAGLMMYGSRLIRMGNAEPDKGRKHEPTGEGKA